MIEPITVSMREIAKRIEMRKIENEKEWLNDVLGHSETIFTTINSLLEEIISMEKRRKFEEKHSLLSIPVVDIDLQSSKNLESVKKIVFELLTTYANFSIHELQKLADYYEMKTKKVEIPSEAMVVEGEEIKEESLKEVKDKVMERIEKAL